MWSQNWFTNELMEKLIPKNRVAGKDPFFIESSSTEPKHFTKLHADVSMVNASDELDVEALKSWRPEFKDAEFVLEDGVFKVGREVEKMSKSKYNVVNPDRSTRETKAKTRSVISSANKEPFRSYE